NILLQIFDDGQASDAFGNQVDFKNTIIIMTSNVGSRELLNEKSMGFGDQAVRLDAKSGEAMKVLRRSFPPEFLNRIDEIVVFNRLGDAELNRVVGLLIQDLNATLAKHHLQVALTDAAIEWLVKTTVKDRAYGARPLRRAIQRNIEDPLAELMVGREDIPGGIVTFDLVDDKLVPALQEAAEGQLAGAKA
ncbi:MAG TPA: AAA family ATPase, partial [Holophagaceae bacterium]|nr:AAA family ATPase [Holophagaceae bacterium]